MADAHTGRLCVQLIYSHFGPVTAVSIHYSMMFFCTNKLRQSIVSVLVTRGRLPLPQLVRFTNLKPRLVRASVLVLIQHNLLWHAHTEEDGEVFEVNVEDCLMRTRFGKFVWQAEELYGTIVNGFISDFVPCVDSSRLQKL